MLKVLHITAHLGLGVGKALSGLVLNTDTATSGVCHKIICLEQPEKTLFVDRITNTGNEVLIAPNSDQLIKQIMDSDIVQLEWWNHPATINGLCSQPLPPMRLLVWCHISGLHTSIIPKKLITQSQKFIFTSPCSYEAANVSALSPEYTDHLGVINSCGGFDGFPKSGTSSNSGIAAGYIGSLNFAKLHPHYVDFLKEVPNPEFKVRMIGDTLNKDVLERQCEQAGRKGLLEFCGYTNDVVAELSKINTLIYLLNPNHYGTTENALLEAMAMGIVPIVLDNPAERHIVEDKKTGFIVRNPKELAQAVQWLYQNPQKHKGMGEQASLSVRNRFQVSRMAKEFTNLYLLIRHCF